MALSRRQRWLFRHRNQDAWRLEAHAPVAMRPRATPPPGHGNGHFRRSRCTRIIGQRRRTPMIARFHRNMPWRMAAHSASWPEMRGTTRVAIDAV